MSWRLDVARIEVRKGNVRLALCVLLLPDGYALENTEYRSGYYYYGKGGAVVNERLLSGRVETPAIKPNKAHNY